MSAKQSGAKDHVHYHKDGTVWAKGQMADGVMTGYWEWFRKDGSLMRSGYLENGEQVGEWTTYAKDGKVVKVTAMKTAGKPKGAARASGGAAQAPGGDDPIAAYAQAQPLALREICDRLRALIDAALPGATSRIWHGSPVWFLGENPVVGYSGTAKLVKLLFWNGQAFDEPELTPVGKHRAAQATFGDPAEIDAKDIRRWLKKAKSDVLDSKAYFKKLREAK